MAQETIVVRTATREPRTARLRRYYVCVNRKNSITVIGSVTPKATKKGRVTQTHIVRAYRAVELLADLAAKVRGSRSELTLAGVETFDIAGEFQFLTGVDDRLTQVHRKLAAHIRRVKLNPSGWVDAIAQVGTGPQESVQVIGEDRVGAEITFRRLGTGVPWRRARVTGRVKGRLILALV